MTDQAKIEITVNGETHTVSVDARTAENIQHLLEIKQNIQDFGDAPTNKKAEFGFSTTKSCYTQEFNIDGRRVTVSRVVNRGDQATEQDFIDRVNWRTNVNAEFLKRFGDRVTMLPGNVGMLDESDRYMHGSS